MNFQQNLEARFKTAWLNNARLLPYHLTLSGAFEVSDKITKKRNELNAKGTLSAKGLDEAMREFVTKECIPDLARSRCKLEASAEDVAAKRQALTIPKPDKSDVAGALLRQELRAHLRGMPMGDRAALLLRDPDAATIAAVFEAPNYLSGIDEKLRVELEARIVAAAHPQELQAVEDERECINLANIAINHAVDTIKKATGYDHGGKAFDEFMTKASAPIEAEFAKKGTPPARNVEDMVAIYKSMNKDDQEEFVYRWAKGDLDPPKQEAA
ncbi:hypothetical protein EHS39_28835 [Ensifer sp. MPMI2T]|nr:hypothetical protein EHS39_28835 [Ensifer sp. MPMI2T]